jgi:hypothetical protein
MSRLSRADIGAAGGGPCRATCPKQLREATPIGSGSSPEMGGPGAPDDINQAHLTQAWLAVSNDPGAMVTGQYFYHMRPRQPNPEAYDTALQDGLVDACARLSGVKLPATRHMTGPRGPAS